MKYIELTQGKRALVDDSDYQHLNSHKWYFRSGYAVRVTGIKGQRKTIWMHRNIANTPIGLDTDHINGDRLDNRKANLRICTTSQNMANRRKLKTTTLPYKGVHKQQNRYVARLGFNKQKIELGSYPTAELAAVAYDQAAVKHFGQFAHTNF